MKPISGLKEAQTLIDNYTGEVDAFELPISDELQDPMGMSMAVITDSILKKNWVPNGFVQKEGFRIYLYKEMG